MRQQGHDQYCLNGNTQTYDGFDVDGTITQGGYAQATVIDEDFVLAIPDSLDPAPTATWIPPILRLSAS
ncbi:MAG: hypothetical protein ACTHW1_07900 [Ancrocorticia sp.]|uniref:hypothetical protein n=1 Tax=Ancrocorticia sp. TaxID=2593684 RepID=UPI003F93E5D2